MSSTAKKKREPNWITRAVTQFRANRIDGNGPWALVKACRPKFVWVALYETEAEASADYYEYCGGVCGGAWGTYLLWHEVFDMRKERTRWPDKWHGNLSPVQERRSNNK